MRYFLLSLWSLFLLACEPRIPEVEINKDSKWLSRNSGLLLYKGVAYDGYLVEYHDNRQLASKTGYLHGKAEGPAISYYPNAKKKEERFFYNNWKEGMHRSWYQNGNLRFQYAFKKDLPIGEHLEYYESGDLFSKTTYNDKGQPDGMQQQFFLSGKIKANYQVVNGRRFGLLGAKGCMGEDESSVNEDIRITN